jgi:hypothetical protein
MENKPCIICLEDTDVFTINDFIVQQPILKSCECLYNIHAVCIIEWIRNNPVCPYCKQQLYLEHNLDVFIDIMSTNDNITNDNIIEYQNTQLLYVEKTYCVRNVLICFFVIMVTLFLGNILYY